MPEKDPQNLSMFHTCLAFAMFALSGALRYGQKLFEGKPFSFGEFIFELISSLFVGMSFYLIARGAGAPEFTAVGVSATMSYFGTKALSLIYNLSGKKD